MAVDDGWQVFKKLGVSYHATKRPRPDQSPFESIACGGHASCTGLSTMLVDACRAVIEKPLTRIGTVALRTVVAGEHPSKASSHPSVEGWFRCCILKPPPVTVYL